jgi:IclR family transcriptional regulator, acetate operon repressor
VTAHRDSPYAARAVLRVLDIIDLLRERTGGATLAELAIATEMPKSSAFRYLSTLESRGYVERESATGSYRLGAAFLSSRPRHLEVLARRARPHLKALQDRFGETVNLGVLDGSRVVYLEIVESHKSMRFVARKGDREPIHSTALGKAIASLASDGEVLSILESEGMPARTERTITDPKAFIEVVHGIREEGFAIDDRENEADGRCVAVPIVDVGVAAALSLSAPASRFSLDEATTAAAGLQDAARAIAGEAQ